MGYDRMYNMDDLLKKLEEDKRYHADYLELLNRVEIKRKKDGTHFANKNQTFVNGRIEIKAWQDHNHPSFTVSGTVNGKYSSYDMDAYLYIDDMRKADPNDKRIEGAKDTDGFWRNTYILTTDEIIEKIEKEKVKQKAYIENYERQIENAPIVFQKVYDKVKELKELIYNECVSCRDDKIFRCSLEYALVDYVKQNVS